MLPPGKKAFVLSQADVCYYEYMDGDGFASRMVIGEDGKPTCEMKLDYGSVVTGDYDLVPILNRFIEAVSYTHLALHPPDRTCLANVFSQKPSAGHSSLSDSFL